MTKTALANKEMREKRGIERSKLIHDTEQQALNRQQRENESIRSAKAQLYSAGMNALGRMGGSGISALAKGKNDPAFYKAYIANLQEFVNVPSFDRLGDGKFTDKPFSYYEDSNGDWFKHDVAGIMILKYLPTIGRQTDGNIANNAINQSLARTKEKVLALNSRSTVNWEAGDLGYNLFCSADIMTAILDLGRVIKVYQTYHAKNAYLAKHLITALGWSYADIEANYAEYRKQYTLMARKFNSAIVVPKSIGLMLRRAFLAGNIFVDSEHEEYPRQMYAYVQSYFLRLDTDGSFARLMDTNIRSNISSFVSVVGSMIRAISDNPDFSEMYQDLRHAFGSDLVTIEESVSEEMIRFNTDPLNREQIHNAEIAPMIENAKASFNTINWSLHQNLDGYIYQGSSDYVAGGRNRKIQYSTTNSANRSMLAKFIESHIFNMHKEQVTGDDIIDITRLRYTYEIVNGDTLTELIVYGCGTEFVHNAIIYRVQDDGSSVDLGSCDVGTYNIASTVSRASLDTLNRLATSCEFDWAPILYYGIDQMSIIPFVDTYTTFAVTHRDLNRIHDACVMGEIYYPDSVFKPNFR